MMKFVTNDRNDEIVANESWLKYINFKINFKDKSFTKKLINNCRFDAWTI